MFQNGPPLPRGHLGPGIRLDPMLESLLLQTLLATLLGQFLLPNASPPPFEWSLSVWETAVTQWLPRGMAVHQRRLCCWTAPQPTWKILS